MSTAHLSTLAFPRFPYCIFFKRVPCPLVCFMEFSLTRGTMVSWKEKKPRKQWEISRYVMETGWTHSFCHIEEVCFRISSASCAMWSINGALSPRGLLLVLDHAHTRSNNAISYHVFHPLFPDFSSMVNLYLLSVSMHSHSYIHLALISEMCGYLVPFGFFSVLLKLISSEN